MRIGKRAAGPFGTGASVALGINSDVYGSVPIGNRGVLLSVLRRMPRGVLRYVA